MDCPHCRSTATTSRKDRTALGYPRFNCRSCRHRFNQRTGTPFNDPQYPTDVVTLAVRWRLRYKLSFRDVAELLLQRGFELTHETVRAWEFRFAPLLADQIRRCDYGAVEYANGLSGVGISNGGEVAVMNTSRSSPTLRME